MTEVQGLLVDVGERLAEPDDSAGRMRWVIVPVAAVVTVQVSPKLTVALNSRRALRFPRSTVAVVAEEFDVSTASAPASTSPASKLVDVAANPAPATTDTANPEVKNARRFTG